LLQVQTTSTCLVRRHNFCTNDVNAIIHPSPDLPIYTRDIDWRSVEAEKLSGSKEPTVQSEAYRLASEASVSGCSRGLAIKGLLLTRGIGCESDNQLGVQSFKKSALDGDTVGMFLYARSILDTLESDEKENGAVGSTTVDELRDGRMVVDPSTGKAAYVPPSNINKETPAQLVRKIRKERHRAGFDDMQSREYEAYRAEQKEKVRMETEQVARNWLEIAAERSSDMAMVLLGNMSVSKEDYEQAVIWYEKAIDVSKNTDAYYNLGLIYDNDPAFENNNVQRDHRKAYKLFAMSAQLGDVTAQVYLANLYRQGTWEINSDPIAARTYAEQAAAKGNAQAYYMLAAMHRAGEAGFEESEERYLEYLHKAADVDTGEESLDAITELADVYYKGDCNVESNTPKALKLFMRAGKLGHAEAMCSAATITYNAGEIHDGFLLYQEAAALGSRVAMRNIASMYYRGEVNDNNDAAGTGTANKKMAERFFKLADEIDQQEKERNQQYMKNYKIHTETAPEHPMQAPPPPAQ